MSLWLRAYNIPSINVKKGLSKKTHLNLKYHTNIYKNYTAGLWLFGAFSMTPLIGIKVLKYYLKNAKLALLFYAIDLSATIVNPIQLNLIGVYTGYIYRLVIQVLYWVQL